MNIQKSQVAEWADYLGLFFLILMGISVSLSIAGTNILAGLVLLCLCFAGQYKKRWYSMIHTPYARMSLVFFSFLGFSMLLGLLFDDVPVKEAFLRLASYKKVLFVAVMIGFFSTCQDHRVQKWCFIAILVGALINLFAILGANLTEIKWIMSSRGLEGAAIFSNTASTGFILITLFWCSGVIWLHTENARGYWFLLALLTAIFLINLNINRTSMVIFPVLVFSLFILALKMHRQKQEGWPWGLWLRLIALIMLAIYLGAFFKSSLSFPGQEITERRQFQHLAGQMNLSMDSLQKASQGNFETSIGTRLKFYQNALPIIAQNPVLGCGVGCIRHEYATTYHNPGEIMTENLHSEYVNLLVQTGVIGLFIFLLWISSFWKSSLLNLPYIGKFRIGMIVIFLMFCIVNSSLMDFHEGWLFCYFTSLCVAPKKS